MPMGCGVHLPRRLWLSFIVMRRVPHHPTGPRERGAFTTLELLVVLAVIAILAALLFPAVVKARKRAAEVVCTSNFRQIHLALALYQDNYKGRFPTNSEFLGGGDGQYPGWPAASSRPLHPYLATPEVFRCPADVGMDLRPGGGPNITPTMFQFAGNSYHLNERLRDRTTDWVRSVGSPSKYIGLYEPPADEYLGRTYVYWHRARKPGSVTGKYHDDERGPRVSPILFVDGHVEFVDFSFRYGMFSAHVD
jgi:prepilin-type processing-associated H-X9-DG protein